MREDAAALAAARWPFAPAREADWLRDLTSDDGLTGFMPPALPDAAWVLHSMYERELGPVGTPFAEYRRGVLAGERPELVAGLDPGEAMGMLPGEHPGPRWRRLRWAELAQRTGEPAVPEGDLPCHTSFPSITPETWPVGITVPSEGSMDRAAWNRLIAILTRHSPQGADTPCLAHYSPLLHMNEDFASHIRSGTLAHAQALYDHPEEEHWSPSNLWSRDRSWVVCTDYDLWATKVAGPASLVEALLDDTEIEAVRLFRDV
ncbi:hypothetical protein AB0C52_21900 [Streptomyces sp. NPDC048717]|uniref:hypothetical protein n=1 Tax=Streptomyces sp. NPDC048717 TaxID=3154928 RepID=UPI003437E6BB